MINLEWQGGIGYGDIVGPISYAYNLSYQLKEKVNLNLHWKTPIEYVYSDNTPEPLYEQAEFINDMCEKSGTDVSLGFIFNSGYLKRFNNYYETAIYDDPKHNEWIVSKEFKHTPTKNRRVTPAAIPSAYSAKRALHSAPSKAHNANIRLGLNRSATPLNANSKVPATNPSCTALVSTPIPAKLISQVTIKLSATLFMENHKEVPKNSANTIKKEAVPGLTDLPDRWGE